MGKIPKIFDYLFVLAEQFYFTLQGFSKPDARESICVKSCIYAREQRDIGKRALV